MTRAYRALFEPGRIGRLTLKNRIVMAPMGSNFAEEDGSCGPRIQAYYETRARGGAGLLTMGVCAVAVPAGTAEPYQVGISHDDHIPGLAELARRVHAQGAKIGMQLQHAGKTATRDMTAGRDLWVPSLPPPQKSTMLTAFTPLELSTFVGGLGKQRPRIRVMDRADCQQMTQWFVDAAARAQEAGFDGIELHAAHSYIFAGFLSPYYNKRDDEYGGVIENRARLLTDTLRAVKARCGADFPVWVRLDGEELRTKGGIQPADAAAAALLAVQAGADAVSVSAYATLTEGKAFTEAPLAQEPNAFLPYAREVKAAVKVPVILAGRVEPEEADAAIARGDIDFVAMGRKLLADPELPIKLQRGKPEDVRPCIYCYVCVSQIFINQRVKCAVNPQTGHEFEYPIEPAISPKRVLVIGGGPAGMEAARVAALRGHRVTLVERADRLGGTLFFAALAYTENGALLDHLVTQVRQLPIDVRLGTEATPALVAELRPDAVIVATGARRQAPPIPGAQQRHVWSGDELRRLMTGDGADDIARAKLSLAERALFKAGGMLKVTDSQQAMKSLSKLWMPLGKQVVIVGGGLVGLELAEFLIARGREVTVLEEGDKPGPELSIVRRWSVLDAVESHGTLVRRAKVIEIGSRDVLWSDADGVEQRTPADSVVLAVGAETDDAVVRALRGLGIMVIAVGDCASLHYIEGAMHGGHEAGRTV